MIVLISFTKILEDRYHEGRDVAAIHGLNAHFVADTLDALLL